MSDRRLCHDCGIADWQDCQCDPDAGLGAPRNPYQRAEQTRPWLRRVDDVIDPEGGWRLVSPIYRGAHADRVRGAHADRVVFDELDRLDEWQRDEADREHDDDQRRHQ